MSCFFSSFSATLLDNTVPQKPVGFFEKLSHRFFIKKAKSVPTLPPTVLSTRKSDPMKLYDFISRIGGGAGGSVYRARDKQTGEILAMKRVKLRSPSEKLRKLREFELYSNLEHPNLVKLYEIYELKKYSLYSEYWLSIEPLKCSLACLIATEHPFREEIIVFILREILKGLEYLHSRNIAHRDIKSDNILVSEHGEIKLSDFETCAQLTEEIPTRKSLVGTPYWMAPELLNGEPYNCMVDIWAVGIVALELADKDPPVIGCVPELRDPGNWSPEFIEFISSCLWRSPAHRVPASLLLHSPFILRSSASCSQLVS